MISSRARWWPVSALRWSQGPWGVSLYGGGWPILAIRCRTLHCWAWRLALLLEVNITLAVFVVSACVSFALLLLQKRATLSSDALLGLLSHSALALGLVVLAFMTWVRIDLMGFLFGDILSVSRTDIAVIYLGGLLVISILALIWHQLFAATVNYELAQAEDMNPDRANLVFMLLMATIIAISMKIVGVLLITAMLIIPAATARRFSTGP